jgi:ComEC/Rec2-related protein
MVRPVFFLWAEVPFFRVLLWMGFALLLPPLYIDQSSYWMWTIPLLPALHIGLMAQITGRFTLRWITGLSSGLCILLLVWFNRSLQHANYQSRLPPESPVEACFLQIDGVADTSRNRIRMVCRWIGSSKSDSAIRFQSRIRLETDTEWRAPPPGTFIVVQNARLSRFVNLRNPNAFDSEGNAQNKGLSGRLKTASDQIQIAHCKPMLPISLRHRAQRLSVQVCRTIYAYLPEREAALACAILLGERQGMNEDMEQAFSGSGLIHLMAVSGMHVGIFYVMCTWLMFKLLRLSKRPSILSTLLMLWSYALLTGLSPSVVRASGMFSLASMGKLWSRHASSYNLMSASALIQIWIDPRLPLQPGFLLSYAAVFGILFLHPRLFSLYWTKNKWLDKAWELSSLSVSAQWFTLPLVLYFFHSFPVYFLPANLLVVPLSAPALIGALLLTILQVVPPLAQLFAYPLFALLYCINEITVLIAALPHAQSTGWYWTRTDFILAFALVACIPLGWLMRSKSARLATLVISIVWYVISLVQMIQMSQSRAFYVYEGYRQGSAAIRVGQQAWSWQNLSDSMMFVSIDPINSEGVGRITPIPNNGLVWIHWQDKTALWAAQLDEGRMIDMPTADVLILEAKLKNEMILKLADKYQTLIFGSGYKPYFCNKLKTLMVGRKQTSCYCVSEKGAINLWNINTSKRSLKKE